MLSWSSSPLPKLQSHPGSTSTLGSQRRLKVSAPWWLPHFCSSCSSRPWSFWWSALCVWAPWTIWMLMDSQRFWSDARAFNSRDFIVSILPGAEWPAGAEAHRLGLQANMSQRSIVSLGRVFSHHWMPHLCQKEPGAASEQPLWPSVTRDWPPPAPFLSPASTPVPRCDEPRPATGPLQTLSRADGSADWNHCTGVGWASFASVPQGVLLWPWPHDGCVMLGPHRPLCTNYTWYHWEQWSFR